MSHQQPHRVGDLVEELDTPALIVCLDKLEENVARMKRSMEKYPKVAVRPHVKTHKCPDIARMQVNTTRCLHATPSPPPPPPMNPQSLHASPTCCNMTLNFAYKDINIYKTCSPAPQVSCIGSPCRHVEVASSLDVYSVLSICVLLCIRIKVVQRTIKISLAICVTAFISHHNITQPMTEPC